MRRTCFHPPPKYPLRRYMSCLHSSCAAHVPRSCPPVSPTRPSTLHPLAPSRRWAIRAIVRFPSTSGLEWSDFAVLLQLLNHPLACLPRTRMAKSGHIVSIQFSNFSLFDCCSFCHFCRLSLFLRVCSCLFYPCPCVRLSFLPSLSALLSSFCPFQFVVISFALSSFHISLLSSVCDLC